jgi:hypothetical protein
MDARWGLATIGLLIFNWALKIYRDKIGMR